MFDLAKLVLSYAERKMYVKRMLLLLIAVIMIMTALPAQPASAAQCHQTNDTAIHEPMPNVVVFASSDPDELPFVPAPGKPKKIRGDADGNGEVNYMDAMLVLRHSVGLEELSDAVVALCDVDNSGSLSYMDAMLILRYSVGLITEF